MNQPETEIDLFPLMNQKPTFKLDFFNRNLYQSDMKGKDLDSVFEFLIPTILKCENDKEYAKKMKEYLHEKMKGNWCVVVGSKFCSTVNHISSSYLYIWMKNDKGILAFKIK
uniref:Dynein light chain n=1 Tax=Noccaea caerulescens TaxID=107243 RepID=A0A1J3HRZ5_NOCCA